MCLVTLLGLDPKPRITRSLRADKMDPNLHTQGLSYMQTIPPYTTSKLYPTKRQSMLTGQD